jgi:molecular chaperone DnaK
MQSWRRDARVIALALACAAACRGDQAASEAREVGTAAARRDEGAPLPTESPRPASAIAPGRYAEDVDLAGGLPLSISIETLGGVSTVIIPRGTTLPARKQEMFSTASDNQASVEVHVLQGERKMARDNRSLARFHLDGIPPAPRGVPQIEVTFEVAADGTVSVTARDNATSKQQQVTVTGSSSGPMTRATLEGILADATAHEAADETASAAAELRNELDALVANTKRFLKESGAKVPAAQRQSIERELRHAERVLAAEIDAIGADEPREVTRRLEEAVHRATETLYRATP